MDSPKPPGYPRAMDYSDDPQGRRAEWFRYYSEKRIGHQWFQVHLLQGLAVDSVLEIGPNLGLVTALLDNAGYRVTTYDFFPSQWPQSGIEHRRGDLREARASDLAGYDAILCCETLEHLPWENFVERLSVFREAAPRHLVISMPYVGLQLEWRLIAGLHRWRSSFSFKKLKSLRRFTPDSDPWGHKWEVGYRGTGLKEVEAGIAAAGWSIRRRDFTSPTRSVFYLLDPA